MKFFKSNLLSFIIGGLVFGTLGVYATSQVLSSNIEYDNSESGLKATNAQDAIDELYRKYGCEYKTGKEWTFDYTGSEQTFTVPCSGTYKLETWGAQGGSADTTFIGGYGSYSYGNISLLKNLSIYINVGGKGSTDSDNNASTCVYGGYNGGGLACGYGDKITSSGGGATHIANVSGLLSTLSNNLSSILIVSGGGGGGGYQTSDKAGAGGNAGGIKGNAGGYVTNYQNLYTYNGGTQTSGGSYISYGTYKYTSSSFGQGGGSEYSTSGNASGGGGGLYGGGAGNLFFGAGGGSGYIGNSLLSDKAMYCYNCTASTDEATKTISNTCVSSSATSECSKSGNGYAKITLVSID